jgi:hypothetical protein
MKKNTNKPLRGNLVKDWLQESPSNMSSELRKRLNMVKQGTNKLSIIFHKDRQKDPKDKKEN